MCHTKRCIWSPFLTLLSSNLFSIARPCQRFQRSGVTLPSFLVKSHSSTGRHAVVKLPARWWWRLHGRHKRRISRWINPVPSRRYLSEYPPSPGSAVTVWSVALRCLLLRFTAHCLSASRRDIMGDRKCCAGQSFWKFRPLTQTRNGRPLIALRCLLVSTPLRIANCCCSGFPVSGGI